MVELDVFDNFESKSKVAQQYVYAQEPDETEIPQHMIKRERAIIAHDFPKRVYQYDGFHAEALSHLSDSRDLGLRLAFLLREDELVDLGLLNERIEHVEDTVRAPNLGPSKTAVSKHDISQGLYLATIG